MLYNRFINHFITANLGDYISKVFLKHQYIFFQQKIGKVLWYSHCCRKVCLAKRKVQNDWYYLSDTNVVWRLLFKCWQRSWNLSDEYLWWNLEWNWVNPDYCHVKKPLILVCVFYDETGRCGKMSRSILKRYIITKDMLELESLFNSLLLFS